MTDIEQAFLTDIARNPQDVTPRLIYADWLEEHEGASRAEFIRLQCEYNQLKVTVCKDDESCVCKRQWEAQDRLEVIAKSETWRNWSDLKQLTDDLRIKNYDFITGCWKKRRWHFMNWNWINGFIEEITCSSFLWLKLHKRLLQHLPLQRVFLTTTMDWYVDSVVHLYTYQTDRVDYKCVKAKEGFWWGLPKEKTVIQYIRAEEWPTIEFSGPF